MMFVIMRQKLTVLICFIISSCSFGQSNDSAVPANAIKFNVISPVFLNLNLSYERIYKKRSSEFDLYYFFPANVDAALGPYIMGVHYKGFGFGLARKYLIMKHGWYLGLKGTFKYKFFNNEHVLVSGKAEESDGQEYTIASNKRYAESLALTFGNIYNEHLHYVSNLFVALGASVISTKTRNYSSYTPGSSYVPPVTPIKHSNSTYFSPEFQIGLKLGFGFRTKHRD
jgi:hypothetical protein